MKTIFALLLLVSVAWAVEKSPNPIKGKVNEKEWGKVKDILKEYNVNPEKVADDVSMQRL